jgi:hypothetical protein
MPSAVWVLLVQVARRLMGVIVADQPPESRFVDIEAPVVPAR